MSHTEARSLSYNSPRWGEEPEERKPSPLFWANSVWRSKCSGRSIFAIAKEGSEVWALITPPPPRPRMGGREEDGGVIMPPL